MVRRADFGTTDRDLFAEQRQRADGAVVPRPAQLEAEDLRVEPAQDDVQAAERALLMSSYVAAALGTAVLESALAEAGAAILGDKEGEEDALDGRLLGQPVETDHQGGDDRD